MTGHRAGGARRSAATGSGKGAAPASARERESKVRAAIPLILDRSRYRHHPIASHYRCPVGRYPAF